MAVRLSLAVIYKNEEHYLKSCLESVADLVQEMVLVDSGSSDASPQIVKAFAGQWKGEVKNLKRAWPGQFADQRNFSLGECSGDWILVLDADESLLAKDHSALRKAIENSSVDAYSLPIKNFTRDSSEWGFEVDEDGQGFVTTELHRLFRNKKDYRYSGILHERIEPSLEASHARLGRLNIAIQHFGKLKEKDLALEDERYRFYEELGRKKIKDHPKDAQAHWELGVVLQKQKRLGEAEAEFEIALELAPHVAEFENYLALCLFQQGKWQELEEQDFKSRRAQVFVAAIEAQRDPQALDALDLYRDDLSQVSLFLFELSLRHARKDRLEKDRREAMKRFAPTGVVEFLEGVQLRRDGKFAEARQLLAASREKKFPRAAFELFLTWNQMGDFEEVIKHLPSVSAGEKKGLEKEWRTLEAYAQKMLTSAGLA